MSNQCLTEQNYARFFFMFPDQVHVGQAQLDAALVKG